MLDTPQSASLGKVASSLAEVRRLEKRRSGCAGMTQQQMAAGAAAPPPATNWQPSPQTYWQSPQAPGQAWSPASFGRRLRSEIEHGKRALLPASLRDMISQRAVS